MSALKKAIEELKRRRQTLELSFPDDSAIGDISGYQKFEVLLLEDAIEILENFEIEYLNELEKSGIWKQSSSQSDHPNLKL